MPASPNSTLDWSSRPGSDVARAPASVPVLTVLLHPELDRIGDRAWLPVLDGGLPVELSRAEPHFRPADGPVSRPLDHRSVSRRPVWLQIVGEDVVVSMSEPGVRAVIDGRPLAGPVRVSASRLDRDGVLLELGGAVLVLLHRATRPVADLSSAGLIGVSGAVTRLRELVGRVGVSDRPVLVRGESGVGKELVSRAVHRASSRAGAPWVAINAAAIPASVATAELFGHARGAFTGASHAREGWFERADGGTLFLDEVGEIAGDVQPQLLRVLDSGEIQPVGRAVRKVNVRLIAATDADLERAVAAGTFRRALYHRLSGLVVDVPPLRERVEDIPILLMHFLREVLAERGALHRLGPAPPGGRPWLRLALVRRLMGCALPGNVRQLRNLAAEIALHSAHSEAADLPAERWERIGLEVAPP